MTEDQEVKASDVIDMVIEHLEDVKNLNAAHEDGGYMNISYASHEKNASYAKIQETLDAYVDQRVMSILNKIGLCKSVDPMN